MLAIQPIVGMNGTVYALFAYPAVLGLWIGNLLSQSTVFSSGQAITLFMRLIFLIPTKRYLNV
jgi:hypothetical protein